MVRKLVVVFSDASLQDAFGIMKQTGASKSQVVRACLRLGVQCIEQVQNNLNEDGKYLKNRLVNTKLENKIDIKE